MARLDEYIYGYERGTVAEKDVCKLLNSILKLGICSSVTPDGKFTLRHRDKERFTSYAASKIRFKLSEPLGLYGFAYRARQRYGLIIALVLMTFFFAFSSGIIWDVRISGNEHLTDYAIENLLRDSGLTVGSRWRKTDTSLVEAEILSKNSDVAWVSVNRRGTVAYVEVIESDNIGVDGKDGPVYSNIVADRDGVITEITVESGIAVVKVGDVVKKGEILISGIVENEKGVYFCRAKGSVNGESVLNVTSEASRNITEKASNRLRLAKARLIIFNFSINIFKNYGNQENNCDIIEETRKFALFNKYRLPIKIEKVYICEYSETERIRSEDEMTEAAKRDLDGKIYSMLKDADLIKIRTVGEFTGDVYRLTSRVVYSTDIGKESAIDIN